MLLNHSLCFERVEYTTNRLGAWPGSLSPTIRNFEGLLGRELRQRQNVVAGVFEPRDLGSAWRRPYSQIVLRHAVESLESSTPARERFDRRPNVGNVPTQRGV